MSSEKNNDLIEFAMDEQSPQQEQESEQEVNDDTEPSIKGEEQEQEDKSEETSDNQEKPDTDIESKNEQSDDKEESDKESDYDVTEIYKFLNDSGIAPNVDDPSNIKDINDVSELIYKNQQQAVEQKLQERLENTTSSYKDLFNHLSNGGKVEDFVNTYRNTYDDIQPSSLKDNAQLQDKVIKDFYKNTTQWDDDLISSNIAKLNDDEKSEFSKKALSSLKGIQKQQKEQLAQQQQQQQQEQEKQRQQQIDFYKKNLSELKQIGELPVSMQDKQQMEKLLFNDVTYNKLAKNFEDYRMNLVVLDHLGLLDDPNQLSKYVGKKKKKTYNFKKGEGNKNVSTNEHFNFELTEPEKSDIKPFGFD